MSRPMSSPATGNSPRNPRTGPPRRGWLLLIPIIGGVLLLLVAVALIIFLGVRRTFFTAETNPGMPAEVVKLTPTASPIAPVSTPSAPIQSCETTIISSGDVQIAVPFPVSLTVSSVSLPVVPFVPKEQTWDYPGAFSGVAAWACGTVVNYVVGLEPTQESGALLADLRPGDEVRVHLSNGVTLFFRFVEQREVTGPLHEAGVFEQIRPRLTLILENQNGTWQVATADYVSETEPVQPPSGTLAQPGQLVRVGDAQVTVTKGHAERGGPDLAPGTMYYLVEFSLSNVGASPLGTAAFAMQLEDGVGNEYLLSPAASAAGEHGPLGAQIEPGATVQGSAGYLVPETLAGPTLIWTFSPQPGSELWASVGIPYQAAAEPASPGQAVVTVSDAFLSSAGDVLNIEGEIRNVGGSALTVELSDISLTSSAGMSALRSAAPPLPWTLQSGQTQVIEFQYEAPDASSVLLTLMGYSFEIRGLR
jgi:hypothetical protein